MKMGKIGKIMMFVFMFGLLAGPVFSLALVSDVSSADLSEGFSEEEVTKLLELKTEEKVTKAVAIKSSGIKTPGMPTAANVGAQDKELEDVIQDIIKWIIGLIILISIFFFAYGGIMYMTAGGDETKVETAKKLLTGAILGLIIALLSWAIVNVIVKTIFGYE